MADHFNPSQQQCHCQRNEEGNEHRKEHHSIVAAYSAAEYHNYQAAAARPFPAHSEGPVTCAVCFHQQVPFQGAACSRRCDWVMRCCCPQCGRGRPYGAQTAFCSSGCAGQARQANWCLGCGVRQVLHGQPSCMSATCIAAVERINHRVSHRIAHATAVVATLSTTTTTTSSVRGSGGRRGSDSSASSGGLAASTALVKGGPVRTRIRVEPHQRLSLSDKLVSAVRQQVGSDVAKRLAAVIKAGGPVEARKQYTAYRCRVEGELNEACGVGAPKFGAGGEGNEQRRFVPLLLGCDGPGTSADAEIHPCRDPRCQACAFVDGGLTAAFQGAETVPAYSTAAKALESLLAARAPQAASGGAGGVILICRVTVGNPRVTLGIQQEEHTDIPVRHVPVEDLIHSHVVKYSNYDIAYVPATTSAIDVQFVATVAPQSAPASTAPSGTSCAAAGDKNKKRAAVAASDRVSRNRRSAAARR